MNALNAELICAVFVGFYLGVAFADFKITWKLKKVVSTDAIFLLGLAILMAITLFVLTTGNRS